MKRPRVIVLALTLGLSVQIGLASKKDEKQVRGATMLTRASELFDLQSQGAIPFHLLAKVRLFEKGRAPVEGSYEMTWLSPVKWREEVKFPDFVQLRLGATERSGKSEACLTSRCGFGNSRAYWNSPGALQWVQPNA